MIGWAGLEEDQIFFRFTLLFDFFMQFRKLKDRSKDGKPAKLFKKVKDFKFFCSNTICLQFRKLQVQFKRWQTSKIIFEKVKIVSSYVIILIIFMMQEIISVDEVRTNVQICVYFEVLRLS
eukprot:TRINITY_DN15005_c0_g1_i1.p3 TRINITY_DN15005_c0_g1~~TRINITY_DN15005_c0_g1_i1.p3  ORF type:complete len:121 (+),score=3.05 TRINITY_DN15005_c0_g1_i1:422-784(+)